MGNLTKFGLGMASILFDLLFILQHFVLYKQRGSRLITTTNSLEDSVGTIF